MSKKKQETKNKQEFYVQGMHCSACEILIKQDIEAIDGVSKSKVSLKSQKVLIHIENNKKNISKEYLNKLFKEHGYTFLDKKEPEDLTKKDILKMIGIGLLFVLSFSFLEKSGFFLKYSVTSESSLLSYFVFGLAAGISSCAALVGGLLLSLSKQWNSLYNNNSKYTHIPFIYFNVSRLFVFALFGGLLGFLGSIFQISLSITSSLTIVVSILMLIIGLQMADIKWFRSFTFNFFGFSKYLNKNKEIQSKYVPIIAGALTFFIPCGFTLIAQSNALLSGNFLSGALKLFAFALGTLPMLALISFSSIKFYSNPKFSKRFSLVTGVVIVFFALYTINSQLNVLGLKSLSDISFKGENSTNTEPLKRDIDFQVMQMEASGFEYFPSKIYLQSGVRTEWQIYDNGSVGCARAVYARGLYPEVIYLEPGFNTVEFIAPEPGTYKISCSMGMVAPVTVEVY